MKSILFFGIYDRNYARSHVLKNGFERNGWKISECHVDPRIHKGIGKYFALARMGLKMRKEKHDLVLVGFPGHTVVWLAWLLFGRNFIFDAFVSLYDSNVFDRKVYSPNSWYARRDRFLDTYSCSLARTVLLDTNQHIDYFVSTFGLPREKFIRVLIGADDTVFKPIDVPEDPQFTVHFHGTFIPLQGIAYIVQAAHILRDTGIHFRIVGHGQETKTIDEQIAKLGLGSVIERIGKVPVEKIPSYMAGAQIVLGIFGDTSKTTRAIPNKVYEAMAMGKTIITADTPGIRELPDATNAVALVKVADAASLASMILELKGDEPRRKRLAEESRRIFVHELLPEILVGRLIEQLDARI